MKPIPSFGVCLALVALLAGGCGSDMPASTLTLVLPAEIVDQVDTIELFVIVPGETARCTFLLGATAQPRDPDYEVETSKVLGYPLTASDSRLPEVGKGGRMFFARAKSQGNTLSRACANVQTQIEEGRAVELIFD
jgi:hypothetical protein